MEFWGKEKRKNIYTQMGLRSIMSRKLYFGLLSSISNFHGNHLIFSRPPPFFLFCKRFDCFNFFFIRDPIREVFVLKKKSSGACARLYHADFILACHAQFLILLNMIRSMICVPIPDPVRDPIRSDLDFLGARFIGTTK